jgi:hypothetical protein
MVLLLSAENFFGIAITLPFRKLLLAIRYSPFATRYSPFAAVSRLADLPISRFDEISPIPKFPSTLRGFS